MVFVAVGASYQRKTINHVLPFCGKTAGIWVCRVSWYIPFQIFLPIGVWKDIPLVIGEFPSFTHWRIPFLQFPSSFTDWRVPVQSFLFIGAGAALFELCRSCALSSGMVMVVVASLSVHRAYFAIQVNAGISLQSWRVWAQIFDCFRRNCKESVLVARLSSQWCGWQEPAVAQNSGTDARPSSDGFGRVGEICPVYSSHSTLVFHPSSDGFSRMDGKVLLAKVVLIQPKSVPVFNPSESPSSDCFCRVDGKILLA